MSALREYTKLWIQLDELFDKKNGDSPAADKLREQADAIELSDEENKIFLAWSSKVAGKSQESIIAWLAGENRD